MPAAVERYLSHLPFIAAQRGAPWGYYTRRVVAACSAVSSSWADVWEGGGDLSYLPAATALELVSDDAADEGSGTGARLVLIEGLGADYLPLSETLETLGTMPAVGSALFLRVNAVRVTGAGTAGGAVGTITVRPVGGGAAAAVVSPGPYSISRGSHFTVAADSTAYVVGTRYSSDDQSTRFALQVRARGSSAWWAMDTYAAGVESTAAPYFIPVEVVGGTDIKVVARRPTAPTALVQVTYEMVVMPKTLAAIRSFGRPQV